MRSVSLWSHWNGNHRRVHIDRGLSSAIALYFNVYDRDPHPSFDCYAFAGLAKNLPAHDKTDYPEYWDLVSIPPEPLGIGDVLFFVNMDTKTFRHAAIHLESGYFISVYGAGGALGVGHFENLVKEFDVTDVFLAKPKQTQPSL